MATQTVTDFDILRTGQTEYLTIFVRDPLTNDLTDVAASSTFTLINISDDSTEVTDTFTAGGGTLVHHAGTGIYQYALDTSAYNAEYLAAFRCVLAGEVQANNIFVKSVTSRHFAYAAQLRIQVDKARKSVADDIENMDRSNFEPSVKFYLGVDDRHLIFHLERGVQIINIIPPYTNFTVDNFSFAQNGTVLIDAATISYLISQGVFSIDTDVDSYSLGGNAFVINHFSKISGFLQMLMTRFDQNLVKFKQQFRSSGVVTFTWQPGGVRSARMLNSLPGGFWSRLLSSGYV
jgi:hypothetical protein